MPDAKLASAKAFKTCDRRKIVDKGAYMGSQLTQPKSRFNHSHDTRLCHGLVVVGGTSSHVRVGVNHHAQATSGNGAKVFFEALKTSRIIHDLLQHAGAEGSIATRTSNRFARKHLFNRGCIDLNIRSY